MSQMNPKEVFHNTVQFNYLTQPLLSLCLSSFLQKVVQLLLGAIKLKKLYDFESPEEIRKCLMFHTVKYILT